MEKKSFMLGMCIVALTTAGLVLEGCKSAPPTPYADVVYHGETDEEIKVLDDTIWEVTVHGHNEGGGYIELLPSGTVMWRDGYLRDKLWMSRNATWERKGDLFKMVSEAGRFYFEGYIFFPVGYYRLEADLQEKKAELGSRFGGFTVQGDSHKPDTIEGIRTGTIRRSFTMNRRQQ
ncbi:MAG: hypothetical protein LBK44_04155 [Spirochaetales bacterium]|jgi:hypothetical protein|nr:hypothetical protein [Spirochaetales bacterium]